MSGAGLSYLGTGVGLGRDTAMFFLMDKPKSAAVIAPAIRQNAGLIVEQMLQAEPDESDPDPDGLTEVPDSDGVLPEPPEDTTARKGARAGRR
jgi:hypothetical protein